MRCLRRRLSEPVGLFSIAVIVRSATSSSTCGGKVGPDLIVSDFRLSAAISASLSGTSSLALINAYWSSAHACRFPPPHTGLFRLLPSGMRSALFECVRPLAFRHFARPLNQVRRHFGLSALADFREHYGAGRWCAYLDLPELVPVNHD